MILWMDKGYVTKRVKKHPILLRAAFLPSEIRNASGNGGGVLIGYMPVVSATCRNILLHQH
jgi:Plavaka transposase